MSFLRLYKPYKALVQSMFFGSNYSASRYAFYALAS